MTLRTAKKTRRWYFISFLAIVATFGVVTFTAWAGGAFDPSNADMMAFVAALSLFSSVATLAGLLFAFSVVMFESEKEEDDQAHPANRRIEQNARR